MTPAISIIHPSRGRASMAYETAGKWLNNANNRANIEYWFSCDTDDSQMQQYIDFVSQLGVQAKYSVNRSAIQAINRVAAMVKGNILIVVSDDFDCFPDWDKYLLDNLEGKTDYLVKTSDGYMDNNWLITLPIMDRAYYNRFGYIYQPDYLHLFSDTEMTCVGNMLGKVVDLQNPNAVFQHNHYTINKMAKDAINEKNDATWTQGKELFLSRYDIDFGIAPSDVLMRYPKQMFL